jgi:hypothetical protein
MLFISSSHNLLINFGKNPIIFHSVTQRENVHEYDLADRQATTFSTAGRPSCPVHLLLRRRTTVHAATDLGALAAGEHHIPGLGSVSELDLNVVFICI